MFRKYTRRRSVIPMSHVSVHGDQVDQGPTAQMSVGSRSMACRTTKSSDSSFLPFFLLAVVQSTKHPDVSVKSIPQISGETCGFRKNLRRSLTPEPQVLEHSVQSVQALVAHFSFSEIFIVYNG